jgi:hypothetical protein
MPKALTLLEWSKIWKREKKQGLFDPPGRGISLPGALSHTSIHPHRHHGRHANAAIAETH